ncbi:spermatogenesis-associated protein 46-like isoform X2 [Ambystoma mexicanum]|uniref:spermatogenesis-associated protein 46-like isoform X2 n=1 Tax=Ambystoma mexicanum TaxID=8296 RepID=UPI0037E809C2
MDHFSLLTISGPVMQDSSVAMPGKSIVPYFTTAVKELTGLPKLASMTDSRTEERDKHRRHLLSSDSSLSSALVLHEYSGDSHTLDLTRTNCTIYRPWFSPYSYFVCTGTESLLESCSFQETAVDEVRDVAGNSVHPDGAKSICSATSSAGSACPRGSKRKSASRLSPKDSISSQDIIMAAKWLPSQQNGHKCVACCRMFPTLHSLQTHIKNGLQEGFSCKVFYRKLKTFWQRDNKQRAIDVSSTDKKNH